MKLIKPYSKKIKFSYVMGRFSKKIGEKYQYFPIDNWQNEIGIAKKFNFDGVEWIISDYSNPIFNQIYLNNILDEVKKKKIIINSIYLDLIMYDPLHRITIKNLEWILKNLQYIQKKTKINRITFPIEEKCRFYFNHEKNIVIKRLKYILQILSQKSKICIETDLPIKNLEKLLNISALKKLGILIDLGNIRANGYFIEDYIQKFSEKIFGIHVKYRDKFFGKSKKLPRDFYELTYLRNNVKKLKKLNDFTFQTYRSDNDFINDMKKSIKNFNETFKNK